MKTHLATAAESLIAPFHGAVSKGSLAECRSLIEQGAYVDARDEKGNSALMMTVSFPERLEMTRMLLEAGAAVNGTNIVRETALFHASRYGNEEAVKLLSKSGAAPDVRNCKGVTALMVAAEQGHTEIVQVLVKAGADVNACDCNGETALMMASAMGHEAVVRILLAAGSDRSVVTPYGWDALMFAEAFDQTEIVPVLKPFSNVNKGTDSAPSVAPMVVEPLVA